MVWIREGTLYFWNPTYNQMAKYQLNILCYNPCSQQHTPLTNSYSGNLLIEFFLRVSNTLH